METQQERARDIKNQIDAELLVSQKCETTIDDLTISSDKPTHHQHSTADIDALGKAALRLEELLMSQVVTEDELLSEFRTLRGEQASEKGKKG